MPTLHNRYHRTAGPDAVYIGRGSPWGNPFVIGTHGDREEVIGMFRERLLSDAGMIARVRTELAGRDLVCFCKPAPCHGDVLLEVANPLPNGSGETLESTEAPAAHLRRVNATDSPIVEYRTGDLLAQPDLDAIAHGVNCKGAMGAGIAKVIRNRWPGLYAPYRERCDDGRLTPGKGFAWATGEAPPNGPRWIYNLASQDFPGPDARLEWVEASLAGALRHAEANGVDGFGLPRIASDIGGLEWADVRDVIERVAASSSVQVVVVTLPGQG